MPKYYVIDKVDLTVVLCNAKSANEILQLTTGSVEHCVEEFGRCDTETHVAIESEWEE
jgi:hypothetical protein